MEGLLLVDKPLSWTSFDVVNHIRGIIARAESKKPKNVKVGHTGTLDPSATGLLVLCIGKKYTKKVPELIIHDKTYEAEIFFGASSTTGDKEGIIVEDKVKKTVSHPELLKIMNSFIGVSMQTPPPYSAVKVNGRKAYELARQGEKVELKPREIIVHSMELKDFDWPRARIVCRVGSGTYIRVLGEDIGKKLGVGAYLTALRRTCVDRWTVEDAISPKDVSIDIIKEKLLALED